MKQIQILKAFLYLVLIGSVFFVAKAVETEAGSQGNPQVLIETNMGSFTLKLDQRKAPETVSNFLEYVDTGFYDGTLFHRVIPGFVIQGGGFVSGMIKKKTLAPVKNESNNGNKNSRGSISMARTQDPHSATSQFFINLRDNRNLDPQGNNPGYVVFGYIVEGMSVIDGIASVATKTVGRYRDVPDKEIRILSARRINTDIDSQAVPDASEGSTSIPQAFVEGVHYRLLGKPVETRNPDRIEVVLGFSYICPHCFEFEPHMEAWLERQQADIDFVYLPAVWNEPMELFARVYFSAQHLNVEKRIRQPLFQALLIEQRRLSDINEIANFLVELGVDRNNFFETYQSKLVKDRVEEVRSRLSRYNLAGVPEIVVNGKYRIDRVRANGLTGMLDVLDFLVTKEKSAVNE